MTTPSIRELLTLLLRREGFQVQTHDSGFGLSPLVRRIQPDLLILDISMPGLRGDSALQVLSQFNLGENQPKVLLFSGILERELRQLGNPFNAQALSKPATPTTIVAAVRACFNAQELGKSVWTPHRPH